MTSEILADLIREAPQFAAILKGMPREARESANLREVPPKKQTAKRGETIAAVDLLIEGRMRVLNEFENGDLYSFAYLTPLSYIGSYEVVARRDMYSATTESLEQCRLIRLPRDVFYKWFLKDAVLARDVAYRLACNTCDQSYKHGEVLFYPSSYLIGEYLLKMAAPPGGDIRRIPSSRQDMAESLGFSIRTINRCIRDFRMMGLISIDKGKVCLSRSQYKRLKVHIEEMKNLL